MPEVKEQYYHFTGWTKVNIYSEQEMADKLEITIEELRQAIGEGKLSYHAHPASNPEGEYQFIASSFFGNEAKWECLQKGGHWFEFDHYYKKDGAVWKCSNCGAERYD